MTEDIRRDDGPPLSDERLAEIRERAEQASPDLLSHVPQVRTVLKKDVPALLAELEQWREAATFWEGPQECLERECEDYFDDDGDQLPGEIEKCSHVEVKTLTPEQVSQALGKLADDDGLVWELPVAGEPA